MERNKIICLYGLMKIITSNHICKILKMHLESKSQNVHTYGTHSGFISTCTVTTTKSIIGSHIGKKSLLHHCAFPWELFHIATSVHKIQLSSTFDNFYHHLLHYDTSFIAFSMNELKMAARHSLKYSYR